MNHFTLSLLSEKKIGMHVLQIDCSLMTKTHKTHFTGNYNGLNYGQKSQRYSV